MKTHGDINLVTSALFELACDEDDLRRTYELAEKYGWKRDDEDDGSGPIFAALLYG